MSLLDGVDVCKGIREPNFRPQVLDYANAFVFPQGLSSWPPTTVAYGTMLFYSNEEELSNFYLQAISPETETLMKRFMGYSDGYAVRVNYSFPVSDTGSTASQYVGFCLTSEMYGQSCVSFKPRSGTNQAD